MGLARAYVRAQASLTAASAEDLLGTVQLWGKINSFDNAFSSGFQDVHFVAPIVFRSAADVPTGDAMG